METIVFIVTIVMWRMMGIKSHLQTVIIFCDGE